MSLVGGIRDRPFLLLIIGLCVTATIFWPGLHGGWLFDDYPNIVDNPGVQPDHLDLATLVRAALSSPASDFKRPLASLSFALNYLVSGLDPFTMKLTNLAVHLLNGLLVFILTRMLLKSARWDENMQRCNLTAVLVATSWLLLPINLTAVLYVVQRMESLANLFVLAGLISYVWVRRRMSGPPHATDIVLCLLSLVLPTMLGALAKETAVMLPLYACLIESVLFGFRLGEQRLDKRLIVLFILVLVLPAIIGLTWLVPGLLKPEAWGTRDFTLNTRLLSEARAVVDYIYWTLAPTPHDLSFYHDNFVPSSGLLAPPSTLVCTCALVALFIAAIVARKRFPLVSLGILLFLSCHLLTATILPLELVYEHRNYFASFGLVLAVIPLLAYPQRWLPTKFKLAVFSSRVLLVFLLLAWTTETALSATAWGDPLKLAQMLADRAPDSPRAQYELGRTYIIYSHYDPQSPFTRLAYAPLESAASLPTSSILPQQALIFMNSRMGLPIEDSWWVSLVAKLQSKIPTIQDESSLQTLVQCLHDLACNFPKSRLNEAFQAALSHPNPSPRLLAMYGDFAWNELDDKALGEHMTSAASKAAPKEPAYLITLARMAIAQHRPDEAKIKLQQLETLNIGGSLNSSIGSLKHQLDEGSSNY